MNAMKLPRTTRLAGVAVAALVATAGAVAVASPAAAKSHSVVINKVTLGATNKSVETDVTYTCDQGSDVDLKVTVKGPGRVFGLPAQGTTTVPNKDLTCDYQPHALHLKVTSLTGGTFEKGDYVGVTAGYPLKNGDFLGETKSFFI
ncbi:hypothetical protein [Streptomyces cinnamoneus]|uniref:hypothetical protein n=1 Tax=Streptomyces sp. NPDC053079 TaxID=3365697 RepID=UPI001160EC60